MKKEIRFKDVYELPDWKELSTHTKAEVLLVAEGAKPGSTVGGNFTTFGAVMAKLGLAVTYNGTPSDGEPVFDVSSQELVDKFEEDEKWCTNSYSKIAAKFYGYPECCADEYSNPKNNLDERKKLSPDGYISNALYEIIKLRRSGKEYPVELNYGFFMPCSATCENAIRVKGEWKEVLEMADPEIAKEYSNMFSRSWECYIDEFQKQERTERKTLV